MGSKVYNIYTGGAGLLQQNLLTKKKSKQNPLTSKSKPIHQQKTHLPHAWQQWKFQFQLRFIPLRQVRLMSSTPHQFQLASSHWVWRRRCRWSWLGIGLGMVGDCVVGKMAWREGDWERDGSAMGLGAWGLGRWEGTKMVDWIESLGELQVEEKG